MSKIIDPQSLEYEAFVQKIFRLLRDPSMRGLNDQSRHQIDRIIAIARIESPNEPFAFIQHLNHATPTNYTLGTSKTRLGQIHMAAELYTKTAQKRRDAAAEAFREQQRLAQENDLQAE